MNKKLLISILVIAPLVLLIVGFSFDRTTYGTDPEASYLFNGLNIAMFESVGHYDHPGTTAHAFCAVVLRVTHFFRFTEYDLQTDVLVNSEIYIEVLRNSFIVFNSFLLFLLGSVAFSALKNMWLAILLQLVPFLSATMIEELSIKIAPEQLLFSSSLMLIMMMLKYYSSLNRENKWFAIGFGFLCGFGLATKLTFLPMLIIPFIILKGNWNKILFLFAVIPSVILFTLPAAPAYKLMFKWFLALGTHTGTYGQGSEGVLDPVQYLKSLNDISMNNKVLVFAICSSILALVVILIKSWRSKKSGYKKEVAYILALFLALSGCVLMVAKHYHSNHYLFPALSMSGVVFVFIYLWLEGVFKGRNRKFFSYSAPALVIVFLLLALANAPYLALAYKGSRMSNQSTVETMTRIKHDYPGYVKTYFYPGSFNEYAQLRWGNVYAKRFHTDALMKLFPDGLFYNAGEKNFQLWETTIPRTEFLKRYGGRILMIGGPKTSEEMKLVEESGLKLIKLSEGRIQVVYEVDTAQSFLFRNVMHSGSPLWSLKNDFETISADKQWIMAGGKQFCKNSGLSGEKPRSGINSFKLPAKDTYAMEFELKNPASGALYEVSIWRFGGDDETSIVVSSKKADMFYAVSKGTVERDSNGWNKISITFRVPVGFNEDMLKVYLWNHSEKPAWFDDFEIAKYK